MKKTYIKPEIEEIVISMQLLGGSPVKIDFWEKPYPDDDEDEEVDDFEQLL